MPDIRSIDDIANRLAVSVGRINRRIRPRGDEIAYGLLSALSTVQRSAPIRPTDLAVAESVTPPTMTRIVADLQARGLVERSRDPQDGRAYTLSATAEGERAIVRARADRAAKLRALLAELTPAQLAAVSKALDGLEVAAGTAGEAVTQ